jgi:hypothetical protein
MHPCAFIQLKNKSTKCYEKALENLVLHSSHPLRPTLVHGDFDKAAQNAFRTVFKCTIKRCFFHFTQALLRQIKEKGLYCLYRDDVNVYKWFQLFKSLAFLPLGMVDQEFEYI